MVEANPNLTETVDEAEEEIWIGFDLGTTFSAVGMWRKGRVDTIQNKDDGLPTTPSFVCYTNKDILVGNSALIQSAKNLESTVYDAKRLIGKSFSNAEDKKMIEE